MNLNLKKSNGSTFFFFERIEITAKQYDMIHSFSHFCHNNGQTLETYVEMFDKTKQNLEIR